MNKEQVRKTFDVTDVVLAIPIEQVGDYLLMGDRLRVEGLGTVADIIQEGESKYVRLTITAKVFHVGTIYDPTVE